MRLFAGFGAKSLSKCRYKTQSRYSLSSPAEPELDSKRQCPSFQMLRIGRPFLLRRLGRTGSLGWRYAVRPRLARMRIENTSTTHNRVNLRPFHKIYSAAIGAFMKQIATAVSFSSQI